MESKIVTLFMFATTAGMTAVVLLVVIHHKFGIPRMRSAPTRCSMQQWRPPG